MSLPRFTIWKTTVVLFSLFVAAANAQEVLFQSDFTSEDGFNVVVSSEDNEFEFDYDYADFDGIPEAPNSALLGGAAVRGLKLQSNLGDGLGASVAVVTDGLDLSGQFSVQLDIWLNYNYPAGAAGTTEFGGLSIGHDGEVSDERPINVNGASFIYDSDGDSGSDYRMYKNTSLQIADTGQYAVESINNTDPAFLEAFPSIDLAETLPVIEVEGTTPAGSGGFRWMTLEALVDTEAIGPAGVTDDPGVVTFTLTDADTGNSVEIGTIDNSNGIANSDGDDSVANMTGDIAVIFTDIFSSVSNDQNLSFGLFDNLIVSTVAATSDPLDCNGDGSVDAADLACATTATITDTLAAAGVIAGDLDANGKVEFPDFLILSENFGDATKGGVYANGDIDLNGSIEFADFLVFSENFGSTAAASAVPEPSCFALLGLGGLLLGVFRKKKLTSK